MASRNKGRGIAGRTIEREQKEKGPMNFAGVTTLFLLRERRRRSAPLSQCDFCDLLFFLLNGPADLGRL